MTVALWVVLYYKDLIYKGLCGNATVLFHNSIPKRVPYEAFVSSQLRFGKFEIGAFRMPWTHSRTAHCLAERSFTESRIWPWKRLFRQHEGSAAQTLISVKDGFEEFVGNAFWMELRSEWINRVLEHICFASMEELSGSRIIFSGFIRFEWRKLRKAVFGLVFLLEVEHPNNDNWPKSR